MTRALPRKPLAIPFVFAALAAVVACADDGSPEYSAGVRERFARRVFFGDLHHHSDNSADAYQYGNTSLSPDDAFRFARGEEVSASNGVRARLRRPLDFLALTDHAEYLGAWERLDRGDLQLLGTQKARAWLAAISAGERDSVLALFGKAITSTEGLAEDLPPAIRRTIWSEAAMRSDSFNDPGRFTAFSGYEWTAMPQGDTLHRCVIFRDGAERVGSMLPFSSIDSKNPEDLWRALARYESRSGGRVLAIPHNGNLSNGLMFADRTVNGERLSARYAEARLRWEPVVEVTQVKGDSETHPLVSPNDEFADFERMSASVFAGYGNKREDLKRFEYARPALRTGLAIERETGRNPFRFGMIGSSDQHTSLSTVEEDNFFGKFDDSTPSADRAARKMVGSLWPNWQLSAAGMAAVWAGENTREALFAALQRREVYATTGPRITLRLFAGWQFVADDLYRPDYARIGYESGVPMGGELRRAVDGSAPAFMVRALKDPDGANLERIQIIKGWIDANGETYEKIYDVALSGGRRPDPATGRVPPVGSTVDVASASYTNTLGAAELAAYWRDPDFDPAQPAFYYARLIEIPVPRWTAYDARFFSVGMPPEVPMTLQERAYSSPVWYTP